MSDLSMKNRGELLRAFAAHKIEPTGDGRVYVPSMKLFAGGVYEVEHVRRGVVLSREIFANIMPTEGLNHIWSVIVGGGTQVNPYYVGVFEGNVTPGATLTHATLAATLTECTAYDQTTRPAYVDGAVAAGAVDNSASRATFTFNAAKTIYGAFLASSSVKGDTGAGTCLSAGRFPTSKVVAATDELNVKVSLAATST